MPHTSALDTITAAATQLIRALENPTPPAPLAPPPLKQLQALQYLADIFNCSINNNKEKNDRELAEASSNKRMQQQTRNSSEGAQTQAKVS